MLALHHALIGVGKKAACYDIEQRGWHALGRPRPARAGRLALLTVAGRLTVGAPWQ